MKRELRDRPLMEEFKQLQLSLSDEYALKVNVTMIERQIAGLTKLEKFNDFKTKANMRFKIVQG